LHLFTYRQAPDHAVIGLNEISAYLSGRLLSASEAAWRLLKLKLHHEFPAVFRLDVHLPNHQQMIFDPTSDPRDILDSAEHVNSTLLEWFALNLRLPSARIYKYVQIPEHFVWKNGTWFERERNGISVGRMFGVSSNNVELFSLRSLLDCVAGATSFEDLANVDGFIHPTFRQACEAYGIIHDDTEWIAAFQEMLDVRIMSLSAAREQFALILLNLPAVNAVAMFNHFAEDLCAGGVNGRSDDSTAAALWEIERYMCRAGRSLTDQNFGFNLHDLPQNPSEFETDIDDYTPLPDLGLTLSAEQLHASVTMLQMLDAFIPCNVLTVVARAGTGKSAWVHSMVNQLRARHQSSICVAASALAATALPHGRTAHAAFNIPVPCHEDTYLIWSDADKKRIRRASIIFWDEISMVSIHLSNALNRSLQRLMKNEAYFGGKCIVFLGDFRQLAPVESTGCTASRLSVTQADWFDLSVKIEFTFNFRASRDMAYAALLESIGDGIINEIEVPASRRMLDIEEMIDQVYVDGITNYTNKNMILAMTLDQCADINEKCMLRVPGDAKLAVASDDLRSCTSPDLYPPEYIASLNFGGVPPAQLTFKKHARYMIIKNYNPPDVCNGVLCELLSWSKFNVQVRLLSGPGVGRIIMIPRCNFSINEAKSGLPFSFARWQFPLIPAYAVTIHKSQGQTLNVVGLLIEADAFAHGIIYVALSRVSSWSNVCFFSPEGSITIKNKVCRQLLAAARVSSIRRLNYPSRL
jgi:hypothetical protein